jgi:hypothetical protein
LVDTNFNQFEILVERINGSIFLTTDFNAIRDFWIMMVFSGLSQFGIKVINMLGLFVTPSAFNPAICFEIEKPVAPEFVYQNVPIITEILTYRHNEMNFQLHIEVKLIKYDVTSGFLVRYHFCSTKL